LTEIFRQAANSRIVTNAHRINQGLLPELSDLGSDSDFYFIERQEPERIIDTLVEVVKERTPNRFSLDPIRDIQVLSPMHRGLLGVRELNVRLQAELNPASSDRESVERFGWQFRVGDKVIQTVNDYDKSVFNGDIGQVRHIDSAEQRLSVGFEGREVTYEFGELGRNLTGVRRHDTQISRLGIPSGRDSSGHTTVYAAPTQPDLHRGNSRSKVGGPHRPNQGAVSCGA
jgi:exodeoxyribonuclease V alpha subunit